MYYFNRLNNLDFFLKQQMLLNNKITAQDEQRLVKLRLQTRGVVYKRNTKK